MQRSKLVMALAGGALVAAGCSTVSPEPGAEEIEVLEAKRTEKCDKKGQSRVQVPTSFGFIKRGDKAIRQDLRTLGRNSAVDMGGDTITPLTEISEGRQTFGIYDCIDE